jgi:hypothetical protein
MSETEKPFTVSDRRHFTPEGRPRDEPEEDPGPGSPPVPEATGPAGAARGPAGPADFSQFLVGLAAQAGMLLSGEGQADRAEAREGARAVIGILEMLKDKTEGRRTQAEDALLDDLLFELRMAFVGTTRGGGV